MAGSDIKASWIRRFVREQLGCRCSDDVFDMVRVTHQPESFNGLPVDCLIEIGNRLLVVVSQHDWQRVSASMEQLVQTGRGYRDAHGFNRFRLVVATSDKTATDSLNPAFTALVEKDDKMHLHIVEPGSLPPGL